MPEVGATREEGRQEAHFDLVVILFSFFSKCTIFLSAAEKMLILPFVIKFLFLFLVLF